MKKCPKCNSKNVGEIIYGYFLAKDREQFSKYLDSGKVHLGGCSISPKDCRYRCNECGNEFEPVFPNEEEYKSDKF